MKFTCIKILTVACCITFSMSSFAIEKFRKDHLIFSVSEEIPMGFENEVLKKNFYINIGTSHGVQKGTVLDVYRTISKLNPYYDNDKKRVNYQVKIGELEVLHTEDGAAIAIMKKKEDTLKDPMFELNNFMIGDHVVVSVN